MPAKVPRPDRLRGQPETRGASRHTPLKASLTSEGASKQAKGNETWRFLSPLESPFFPFCSEPTSGNHDDRVPLRRPSPIGKCQTGARRQGSASPRQKPARPCLLRAVLARWELRRAAPAGTRSKARSGFQPGAQPPRLRPKTKRTCGAPLTSRNDRLSRTVFTL